MTRRARQPAANQDALPLPCDPNGEDALRRAFAGSGLCRHGYNFERALATPAVSLTLLNVARGLVANRGSAK